MSWADLKRKYERGGCAASQSTEDMVARRLLRSMGITESGLWKAEREAGTENERREDSTLLERAVRIARTRGCDTSRYFFPPPAVRDVKSFRDAESTLFDLIENCAFGGRAPVLIYRIKGSGDVRALQSAGCSDVLFVGELPVPCMVLRSRDRTATLVDCEASTYFDTIFARKGKD